ncbi:sodium/solute symporter [Aliifodinibius sp. S!AR15-10]|uniref:sodium:solute symporter family transporter n=1 Tax=Aliifodinibius sp. S!AR15-10 TaxID=2950437 RepID=UPI0028552538|nr:sodium/solute symporter [Aliifodinibius sp. S!AR15-10]MDR8390774.1 sodium/solute symporter [Aliifodinibius sp. S!AR15-10]
MYFYFQDLVRLQEKIAVSSPHTNRLSLSIGILLLLFTLPLNVEGQQLPEGQKAKDIVSWEGLPDLPNSAGVAGAFVGRAGDAIIVAGGANFPDRMPWEGGTKVFHDDIYVLKKDSSGYRWISNLDLTLPAPLAYGATIQDGDGLILIGGTEGNKVSRKVLRLRWQPEEKSINLEELPSLPKPLAFMEAARIGNKIYVAGGQHSLDSARATKSFWELDLSQENTGQFQWKQLPAWPGPARVHPIAAAQHKGDSPYFFLFSGRNVQSDGSIEVLKDAYRFNTKTKEWNTLAPVAHNLSGGGQSVMGGSAVASGDAHILIFGGDPGDLLMERLKKMSKVDSLNNQLPSANNQSTEQVIQQQIDRLGRQIQNNLEEKAPFSKDILSYHTITDTYDKIGELPVPAPVTTQAVKFDEDILIVSGEIRPGIRTAGVWKGNIEARTPTFGWINYSALALYGLILVGMGVYFSRREDATDDYFLAGNRIPWWAAGISIYATQLSAITFISTPVLSFADNWIVFIAYFTIFLMAPVVIYFYLPFFRRLKVTSAYEYLEKRFHLGVRLFGSISFILFQLGRMSVVVFLPALTLTAILDMNIYAAIILMGVLAIIYTTLGGIEAVIWSDVLQVFILISGIIYSLYFIIDYVGGLDVVYTTAIASDKLQFFDFDLSFTSLATWSIFLGSFALQFGPYTTAVIQRYLTTEDEKSAADSIWTNGIISIPTGFLFFALGTCFYVFYKLNPEFLSVGMQNDQVFPLFIGQQLPVGFAGLLIAGIFSASMSSLDSSMHSVATVVTVDFYKQFVPTSKEKNRLYLARLVTVIVGALGTLIACLLATLPIQSLYFFFQEIIGLLSSALAGIFILGIFTQRTHGTGALIGAALSLVMLYIVKFYTPIHFYIYPLIGIPVCVIVGYLVSLVLPDHGKKLKNLTYRTLVAKS